MSHSHLAGPDKIQTINMSQSELLGVVQRVRGGGKEYLYSVLFVRVQQSRSAAAGGPARSHAPPPPLPVCGLRRMSGIIMARCRFPIE